MIRMQYHRPLNVHFVLHPWGLKDLKILFHEIEVIGESGHMKFSMENVPHPKNHMTSYLAVLSAVETLKRACGTEIQVGA